jgi:hypothetical protein
MRKLLTLLVLGVAALSLTVTGAVHAQGDSAATAARGALGDGTGILHDYMVGALAEALGITADDLQARLASGETLATIALDLGVSADELPALWLEARQNALDAAVADGVIADEQAAWMLGRVQAGSRASNAAGASGLGPIGVMRGLRAGVGAGTCPRAQP